MILTVKDSSGIDWDVDYQEEHFIEDNTFDRYFDKVSLAGSDVDLQDCINDGVISELMILAIEHLESLNLNNKVKVTGAL